MIFLLAKTNVTKIGIEYLGVESKLATPDSVIITFNSSSLRDGVEYNAMGAEIQ